MSGEFEALRATVQRNCDIANAKHAADATLCIYLLRMREYFRWKHKLGFEVTPNRERVGEWIRCEEQRWETLEESAFAPLEIAGQALDPFASDAINAQINSRGLVYSAGIGQRGFVHFFLGDLEASSRLAGRRIRVSGVEHARDLNAPPAMSLGDAIFLRRESIERMVWEKCEDARLQRNETPMRRAMQRFGFEADLGEAVRRMADAELDAILQHEIGEALAGELLGPGWEAMIGALLRHRAELLARAVRDNLADALRTLPHLLEHAGAPALHLYMSNLTALRKTLWPALAQAYDQWLHTGTSDALRRTAERGRGHWEGLARRLVAEHERGADAGRLAALAQRATL